MTYEQCLTYIHSLLRFGMKPGLARIRRLCELLGNPQKRLRFIHVAGTNGKGSTCAMLASILRKAGYKTGLYTSPFVTDFCERMQINGTLISHEELSGCVEELRPIIEKVSAEGEAVTEFEAITALAFHWFEKQGCDVVVLETGLGGRFDATNVIESPLCSVITSIGLDHTQILGDTLSQIAFEKCGIIKPQGRTVCYPSQAEEALEVIERRAKEEGNILRAGRMEDLTVRSMTLEGSNLSYRGFDFYLPLIGIHQHANAVTVLETAEALREAGLAIDNTAVREGIRDVVWPARLEIVSRHPLTLLDGAHNPQAMSMLADTLKKLEPGKKFHVVLGMLADKDYPDAVALLAPLCASAACVTPDNPRALPSDKLARELEQHGVPARSFDKDYQGAVDFATQEAGDGMVLLCGSLYLAGSLRPLVLKNK
nr:folylpolyglutamate synthase/dihydrofolate synthase family protein [uncultured Solibaculum sp.]